MAETGIVKWFDCKKGYGFITRANGEKDVFVHATDLRKSGIEDESVDEGQGLSFEVATTPRGIKAVRLSRTDNGAAAAAGQQLVNKPVTDEYQGGIAGVVPNATIPDPEAT